MITRQDDPALYARIHRLVRKTCGPARDQACAHCNKSAHDWAQIHDTDGTNPQADYMPLCRSCHEVYDQKNTGRQRTAEQRSKISAAKTGVSLSNAHKIAIGNGVRGIKRNAETKRRMSEAATRRWAREREINDADIPE